MIIDLEKQLTIILLNQGWTKKDISTPGEVHFAKAINPLMLIEVVIMTSNKTQFLNISVYNTTGIGKEHVMIMIPDIRVIVASFTIDSR